MRPLLVSKGLRAHQGLNAIEIFHATKAGIPTVSHWDSKDEPVCTTPCWVTQMWEEGRGSGSQGFPRNLSLVLQHQTGNQGLPLTHQHCHTL